MTTQHYKVERPLRTHWRTATCEEVGCRYYQTTWTTTIDPSTDLGKRQYDYIKYRSGRIFTETKEGGLVVFTFPPGQPCFARDEHKVLLERDPLFRIDHLPVEYTKWMDEHNEKLYQIGRRLKGG